MTKRTKIWFLLAASLILIGSIILGGAMAVLNWDFSKLSTTKYVTNAHEIHEDYRNISIVTSTADIVFVPSESEFASVVCYEQENFTHTVSVKDGTLVIEAEDTRAWYAHIGINFAQPRITVSIPQGTYGSLSIHASTGDVDIPGVFGFGSMNISLSTGDVKNQASVTDSIRISTNTGSIFMEHISAGSLALSVSTGSVALTDVTCLGEVSVSVTTGKAQLTNLSCGSVVSTGTTGNISLKNVIAAGKISLRRSTGDVTFDRCDAGELFIDTTTGTVKGTLCSDKVFIVDTGTGSIDVPKTITGGRCEISTGTGSVKISIAP